MVSKTVCFSMVVVAVLVITTAAKPCSEGDTERDPPPKLRMNRHGKRGFFGNLEEQASNGDTEYDILYDTRDMRLADSPQRLRMNRHGK